MWMRVASDLVITCDGTSACFHVCLEQKSATAQSYDHLEPPPLATVIKVEIVQPRTITTKEGSNFCDYLQLQIQKRERTAFMLPDPTQRTLELGTAAPSPSLRPPALT